jgi:hypothetical protein
MIVSGSGGLDLRLKQMSFVWDLMLRLSSEPIIALRRNNFGSEPGIAAGLDKALIANHVALTSSSQTPPQL